MTAGTLTTAAVVPATAAPQLSVAQAHTAEQHTAARLAAAQRLSSNTAKTYKVAKQRAQAAARTAAKKRTAAAKRASRSAANTAAAAKRRADAAAKQVLAAKRADEAAKKAERDARKRAEDAKKHQQKPTPKPTATPTPSKTATPTPAPVPTISGAAAPTGDVLSNGRLWKQSYVEDFNTPAATGKFAAAYPGIATYDGFNDTSGLGRYAPGKVLSVSNGNLDMHMRSENGQPLVAAIMPDGYAPHTTGRVSVRYKTTKASGYKFVGMLWPSSDNWNEGEVDWPEADLGSTPRPASAVPGSYRDGRMTFEPAQEMFAGSNTTEYHVATTEWDRDIVRFYWDDKLVATTTKAVPTTPFRVTLQGETWIGEGPVPANADGHVSIDWISIWD